LTELVHNESLIMRQVKPASLTAVLRPDAQTEVHLQLRFDRNGIEAICRCERGDLQSLKSSWAELQQRLANHGVRLLPIEPARGSYSGSLGGSAPETGGQQSRRDRNNTSSASSPQPEAPSPAPLPPSSKPARRETPLSGLTRRLLESWA
jgi:hypothetical protein